MSQLTKPIVKLVKTKKQKRAKESSSSSDSSDSFSSSGSSDDDSRRSSNIKPKPKSKLEPTKAQIKKPNGIKSKPVKVNENSSVVSNINVRAIAHQMSEFKQQFDQKMTRLELLLKEGFKAVADCSIQIEKLRADMNLPE
jgi:hypothetical protein